MKKIFIIIALSFFSLNTIGQKVRVFEHLDINTVFGNRSFMPSVGYSQSLAFGKKNHIKISSGVRYSNYFLNKQALQGQSQSKNTSIELTKRIGNSGFNIPIGIELTNRIIGVGVNADILGVNLGKVRNVDSFKVLGGVSTINEPTITAKRVNFLPTMSGTLASQLYLSLTPNPTLSIKVGMAYTQIKYKGSTIVNLVKQDWDTFKQSNFSPFVGLQFNFER